MKITHLIETEIKPSVLPRTTWYHCGPDFDKFSAAFLGTGENNHLLGHGIYFINVPEIAMRYAKYVKVGKPVLYEVQLQNVVSDDLYCSRNKPSAFQAIELNKLAKMLGYDTYQEVRYRHSIMQYGRGMVGAIFERFGSQKGAQILIEHGIHGQFEDVGDGVFELAMWDVSLLKIVNKQYLPEPDRPPVQHDPDLDAWWDEMMKGEQPK